MSSSSSCISAHVRVLRSVCVLPLSPPGVTSPRASRWHEAARLVALVGSILYLGQESIYAYQSRKDLKQLSGALFLLLCNITCVAKVLAYHVYADHIQEILARLDGPLYNRPDPSSTRLLSRCGENAHRLLKWHVGTSLVICLMWSIPPTVQRLTTGYAHIPFVVYIDYNCSHWVFFSVLLYIWIVSSWFAAANTTTDVLIVSIISINKTQITILRRRLDSLPERAHKLQQKTKEDFETIIRRLFTECVQHHQEVIELTKMLERVFSVPLLVQFGICGWIICMSAYQIISLRVQSVEFASMVMFVVCVVVQLFIYCYYGNELAIESAEVVTTITGMKWYQCGRWIQRCMLHVISRSLRPLRPMAAGNIPLSLPTFITVMRSSYSLLTVLRQTK